MDQRSFFEEIVFVIVVYEKRLYDIESLGAIKTFYDSIKLTPTIFVYDNSTQSQRVAGMQLFYVHNPTNAGVSRAYNVAYDFAVENNKRWLCLLDQDTSINEELFNAYIKRANEFPDEGVLVPVMQSGGKIVSPYKTVLGKGRILRTPIRGRAGLNDFKIINSCMLIKTRIFRDAGGFDESFPLDYSDNVFCERLKKVTHTFVVVDTICQHDLSSRSDQTFSAALERFRLFATATVRYGQLYRGSFSMNLILLTRAMALAWRYRSIAFFRTAWQSIRVL